MASASVDVKIAAPAKDAKADAKAAGDDKDKDEEPEFSFVSEYACVVRVVKGQDLPGMDIGGKSDPYVIINVDGVARKTKKIKNTVNPEWNEQFGFVLPNKPKTLTLEAFDYDKGSADDKMGHAKLDLTPYVNALPAVVPGAAAAGAAAGGDKKAAPAAAPVYNQWIKLEGVPKGHTKPALIWLRFECNQIQKAVRRKKEAVGMDGVDLEHLTALLDFTIVGSRNLKHSGLFGSCHAFAKMQVGHYTFFTPPLKSNAPEWNQVCPVWIGQNDPMVTISVADGEKRAKATVLGQVYLRPSFFVEKQAYDLWLPLVATAPTTDAELSKMMEGLKSDINKPLADDKKTPALHIRAVKKPKAHVQESFYKAMIDEYDSDKNGTIELEELLHMIHTLGSTMTDQEIEAIFKTADTDKSGKLRKDELYKLFANNKFQSADLLRKLYSVMTYGKNSLQHLTMRGFYVAANDEFKDEKGNASVETATVEKVLVYDRDTQLIVQENIPGYIKSGMRLLYRSSTPSSTVTAMFRTLTKNEGAKMDNDSSAANIPAFIQTHHLNTNEILVQPPTAFKTFNEFFFRKLKPGARLCHDIKNDYAAVSPADCRLMVFETIDDAKRLWIKGEKFGLSTLLAGADPTGDLAKKFIGGSLVICRLAPQDYHRWHFPVSGTPQKRTLIQGEYYTVNPIAIRKNVDVYTTNKRCVIPIESREFGTVIMIAVGATMVGSIHFCCPKNNGEDCKSIDGTCCPNTPVKKFDENGYFAFGGSTVLVLFRPGSIVFDQDLLQNSNNQLETLVKVGASLGTAPKKKE